MKTHYILDTSALMENCKIPALLLNGEYNANVHLSSVVNKELDGLKNDPNKRANATKARDEINNLTKTMGNPVLVNEQKNTYLHVHRIPGPPIHLSTKVDSDIIEIILRLKRQLSEYDDIIVICKDKNISLSSKIEGVYVAALNGNDACTPFTLNYYLQLPYEHIYKESEVKSAYRKLSKQYHPDGKSLTEQDVKCANDKFNALDIAYKKIKDNKYSPVLYEYEREVFFETLYGAIGEYVLTNQFRDKKQYNNYNYTNNSSSQDSYKEKDEHKEQHTNTGGSSQSSYSQDSYSSKNEHANTGGGRQSSYSNTRSHGNYKDSTNSQHANYSHHKTTDNDCNYEDIRTADDMLAKVVAIFAILTFVFALAYAILYKPVDPMSINRVIASGVVTVNNLNVRSQDSSGSAVLTQLDRGSQISIIGERGYWYQIQFRHRDGLQRTGWVHKDYISKTDSPRPTTAPQVTKKPEVEKTAEVEKTNETKPADTKPAHTEIKKPEPIEFKGLFGWRKNNSEVQYIFAQGNKIIATRRNVRTSIYIHDISERRIIQRITSPPPIHPCWTNSVMWLGRSFAIEGDKIITTAHCTAGRYYDFILVFDMFTGDKITSIITDNTNRITSVAANNGKIVIGSRDKTLKIWDMENRQLINTLTGHTSWIEHVIIDGNRIISAARDGNIKIWNMKTGEIIRTIPTKHRQRITTLTMHNGNIISGSADGIIKIWNSETGRLIRTIDTNDHRITSIAVSGNKLISWNVFSRMHVWDMATGKRLGSFRDVGEIGAIVPESNKFVTGDHSAITVWEGNF